MNTLVIVGLVLIVSALTCKLTNKIGLPVLVGFILIGVLIGMQFDIVNVHNAESICNFALLFIIFTGGLNTDFAKAKPVLGVSALIATAGTVLTAGIAALFAYFVLGLELHAALLLGAVISATDAASVLSILTSKKISFKNRLGSVLEMESGSNDPFAYMLTIVFLALATGESVNVPLMLLMQVGIGAAVGLGCALLGRRFINKLNLEMEGLYAALLCGTALLMYGLATMLGGNGFLAVYIGGMILGNSKLVHKKPLTRLFGVISMLMEITLFIVLGILFIPGQIMTVLGAGLLFAAFMFFAARPLVITVLMKPFKYKFSEIAVVSWSGFRGASSIVFAAYLLAEGLPYAEYIFSLVFFVCILSVVLQGSLLAGIAKRLGVIAPSAEQPAPPDTLDPSDPLEEKEENEEEKSL